MIEHVWSRARQCERIDRLVIATDDQRILDAAHGFGAEAIRTSRDHASGTDRVAEVVRKIDGRFDIVINLQGDEPLLTPTSLDRLLSAFDLPDPPEIATLSEPIETVDELFDPNVVKLVTAEDGRALYFSRSPIPYHRGTEVRLGPDFRAALAQRASGLSGYRKHQGIYAYTRETLMHLTRQEPSDLERDEGLEQLRALQAGYAIHVLESDFRSISVDTPQDLERVNRLLADTETSA